LLFLPQTDKVDRMTKIDLKKDLEQFYTASPEQISLVEVPPLRYLMAEGQGDPNTAPAFREATETLFRLSYALKFRVKKEQRVDYTVMPLERLWSVNGNQTACTGGRRDEWKWTLMILQPDFITQYMVAAAREAAQAENNAPPLYNTTFGRHIDGESAQILHVGPYSEEAATIARLHRFIKEKGYHFGGKLHQIYLSDPRRTPPDRLRTILRQPISLEVQR
jgi:hypothetical protein